VSAHDEALDTLAHWQAQGARRLDPVRFDFLLALARRRAACAGPARALLDARLAAAMGRYEGDLAQAGIRIAAPAEAPPLAPARRARAVAERTPGALARLVARAAPPAADGDAGTGHVPETLAYIRRIWARLDARRRLALSQSRLPANAGPLNSQQLVHRALTLMQDAAPGYLHQLMAYVDALAALEPFQPAPAAPPVELARAASGGGARKKPEKKAEKKPARARRA